MIEENVSGPSKSKGLDPQEIKKNSWKRNAHKESENETESDFKMELSGGW